VRQLTLFDAEIRRIMRQTRLDLDIAIAAHANDPWELSQRKPTIDEEKAQ